MNEMDVALGRQSGDGVSGADVEGEWGLNRDQGNSVAASHVRFPPCTSLTVLSGRGADVGYCLPSSSSRGV